MTPSRDTVPSPVPRATHVPRPITPPHAAGLDLGAAAPGVAVSPDGTAPPVRRVGAFTVDLEALAAWLQAGGVTPVARDSTGVSWLPWVARLERRGFQGLRGDPRQGQRAPGRPQRAAHDGPGRQRLPTDGLLAGACRPAAQVCGRRGSLRQRQLLLTYAGQPLQPRPQALARLHLQRPEVVRDLTGGPGMPRIQAIRHGAREPLALATLRDRRGTQAEATIASALHGHGRPDHRCAWPPAVEREALPPRPLAACDRPLEAPRPPVADQSQGQPLPPRPRRRQRQAHEPSFDARTGLSQVAGGDLPLIDGLEAGTALLLRRAIGTDLSRGPSVKHCCRGRGRCPPHPVAGGPILSRRGRPGAKRAAQALRLAASCRHHSRRARGACLRRRPARMGTPPAITATAHTLARLGYRLLTHGPASVAQGLEAYAPQPYQRQVQPRARQARALGLPLMPAKATV